MHPTLIVIDVDDDGTGLDPAMRDRVLSRGVRADEGAPGSGLGLAIVRELAEAYGGAIALDQSPQGGVRARLTLPMRQS
jgi:signal transduction histidine kinase